VPQAKRHTVIFGLGITGYSCLRFLYGTDRLTVIDTRTAPPFLAPTQSGYPDARLILGAATQDDFTSADRIVVSPGLALSHCLLQRARDLGIPLVSDIELFLQQAAAPVVGITGTNGKSTVTALTGELLRSSGLNAGVGGNLGEPALDLLEPSRDAYVLELSSFQLERLVGGRFPIAANLNVTPDHLDRYPSVASYAESKQRIFAGCDIAVFNRADPLTFPSFSNACGRISVGLDAPPPDGWGIIERRETRHLGFAGEALMPVDQLGIHGRHNEFNALAAMALARAAGGRSDDWSRTLREFKGLDHRCQTVAVLGGITFINDSKATNLGACVAALEGLGDSRRHIILIAGGDAKNADLSPLRDVVGKFVRQVVTLGKDAAAVEAAIAGTAPSRRAGSMDEAVRIARSLAGNGDLVLLSPACASLDMYTNFEARGRDFARAVMEQVP
jgi:UDP-N-acetylmuramoylalanine--D-glutamate ligase